ncbi:MAG: T9SS type A sorting domain-containing protein [Bacteroidia bacterium]|nr:T9SS type A sorting domain-containing protein [Bacteroidia bacterium]
MKKYLLILFTSFLLPILSNAQEIEWQNTIGGNDWDHLNEICQTSDGGYICGGWSRSNISGDKTENNVGGDDYWVVKLDALGNIEWQNSLGGLLTDYLNSIAQSSDGGYICGGYSRSNVSGDKSENNLGSTDYWVVKLDSVGNVEWDNTIGGIGTDLLVSVKPTIDGGFICGGYSDSDTSSDKSELSQGGDDYWVVKLNSTGQIEWENTIGGTNDDNLYDIIHTTDGGYLCGGLSKSPVSGDKTEDNPGNGPGNGAFWVVKLNSTGTIQWQNTIGGGGGDLFMSVEETSEGGYICGGYSNSNIGFDKTENSHGGSDIWIVKLDILGNIEWQNTIGTSCTDYLKSVSQASDGGYICGGYTHCNISGDKTENRIGISDDFWVIKLDSVGNISWQNTIGGEQWEILSSIIPSSDGYFIAAGVSNSNISGDKTEDSMGDIDFWVVKISNKYNLIKGRAFLDDNTNGTFETGETRLGNKIVTETSTGRIGITQNDGKYSVAVPDTGSFEVSGPILNYYATVPISHNAYFNNFLQSDSLNDFAVQSSGTYNDLCVQITPAGNFRSGFNAYYYINYSNLGTTILNPTIVFYPDTNVMFSSSDILPTSITSDSIVWNLGPLLPFATEKIMVIVQVDLGLPIGTLINSGALIEPIVGDANLICNQSYWEVYTTGSYDPNDILVDEDTLLSTQFPNPPFLEYLIRFQNTGNDTAFTVKILNLIDTTMLDLSSFEFVASSHPVNLSWLPWERNMQFMFNNILLPDSNINEPQSHGFVRYRIQPKSNLVAGDSITNNAAIYFDFNNPILTNTAYTQIILPTSIQDIVSSGNLLLYPNPANSSLTIETRTLPSSGSKLTITDVAGRTLLSKSLDSNSTTHQIDISSFSSGIYFIQLDGGKGIERGRFVKE